MVGPGGGGNQAGGGGGNGGGGPGGGGNNQGQGDGGKNQLDAWLKKQEQQALKGGLLRGAKGTDGKSGLELIDLLKSNPELARNVRTWMEENTRKKGLAGMLDDMAGGGRRPALLAAFPELLAQFTAATGKALVYDAEGNPVRLARPGAEVRPGDELVVPDLIGADGAVKPPPATGVGGFDVAESMMAAAEQKQLAQTGGDVFPYEDLVGGEE